MREEAMKGKEKRGAESCSSGGGPGPFSEVAGSFPRKWKY